MGEGANPTTEDIVSKYQIKRTEQQYVLSEESAVEQVMALLTYYDIDVDRLAGGNDLQEASLEKTFDQLTDYVRRGLVEVGENGTVTQHLGSGQTLQYAEIGAKHKLVMDKVPQGQQYAKMYALMGSLASCGSTAIEKLPAKDLAVVEVLSTVFSNA